MGKILITGATGLIGSRLTQLLLEKGQEVVHLGRKEQNDTTVKSFVWNIDKKFIDHKAFEGVDCIIHLAGAGIADKPWSDGRKREILESRTHSTRLLFEELKKGNHQVKTFVSASATGYYGFHDNNKAFIEEDGPGNDFLATVVRKWEEEVRQIESLSIRVAMIRVGIVLSTEGGALKELIKPVKFYVGAPLGSGKQNLSWIHIDDLCRIFIRAAEDPAYHGVYNGVGPYTVTNKEFTLAIGKTMNRPIIIPAVPQFALRLLFGEMADLVLKGNRVSAKRLLSTGFRYKYDTLEKALEDLLRKT